MNDNKKMGRPIKNKNRRTEKMTIMLSPQEKKEITDYSDKLGLSRTDTIIKAIKLLKSNHSV